jgi:rod shape-determining protein MreB
MFVRAVQQFGIDLGTCNTAIYQKGNGIVMHEPSVVAIWKDTDSIAAYGAEAKAMLGRTSARIEVFYPLKEGVLANFELMAGMIKYFIKKIKGKSTWFGATQFMISIPCGVSDIQKRAIEKLVIHHGTSKVIVVERSLAAAMGEGLPVYEPIGSMVLDIGGSTSQAALISMGKIVESHSIPVGGKSIDQALIEHMRMNHHLAIGERTAEEFKLEVIRAMQDKREERIEIKGRDLNEGLPKAIFISIEELRSVFDDFTLTILNCIRLAMEKFPPELLSDVLERGILLSGGGSLLPSLYAKLQTETGVSIHRAEKPLECVAIGAGLLLLNLQPGYRNRNRLAYMDGYQNIFMLKQENELLGIS